MWFKSLHPTLRATNGYAAVESKYVLIAGYEHVKNVQPPEQKGFILGKQDRRFKDKKISKFVVINSGEYKGLKAKVVEANDITVKLEILANDMKINLAREQVTEIRDPTQPIEFRSSDFAAMSFESAAA